MERNFEIKLSNRVSLFVLASNIFFEVRAFLLVPFNYIITTGAFLLSIITVMITYVCIVSILRSEPIEDRNTRLSGKRVAVIMLSAGVFLICVLYSVNISEFTGISRLADILQVASFLLTLAMLFIDV